ncbi:hypothetical protein JG688_00001580 [Phytophthora aleatoria]|uniref:Uncharacterized protein n=1 Tax=Phytophthora aleatoria TaxID=2496075 RepID=A0A8J5IXK1_9STRA|nr:hypothetical protein JG688_00001580 [Phytophthora aleatoria]
MRAGRGENYGKQGMIKRMKTFLTVYQPFFELKKRPTTLHYEPCGSRGGRSRRQLSRDALHCDKVCLPALCCVW